MASETKTVCPVCQRSIAVKANGTMARHGYRTGGRGGMSIGGSSQCPTSGWGCLNSAVQFALKHSHERLATLPEAAPPANNMEMTTKEYRDRCALEAWIRTLERALVRCPPVMTGPANT